MYKYYAGMNPLGRVMGFSMGTLSEVMGKCGNLVDGVDVKSTDVDLCFIACNGGKRVTNWLSPEKGLVRYQISEAFTRLACDKFLKTGFTTSYLIAIQKCFEEYVLPFCRQFDSKTFRKEMLHREELDILYTRFEPGLRLVFKNMSGKYSTTSNIVMGVEEFV